MDANIATTTTLDPFRPSNACQSILDNDLYKFTMQQAVRQHYPNTPTSYAFTNRSPEIARIPPSALPWLTAKLHQLSNIRLTQDERQFLERRCPYLTTKYLDWLQHEFRFQPSEQIKIEYSPVASFSSMPSRSPQPQQEQHGSSVTDKNKPREHLSITVTGLWDEVILYEIPILALVSEAFFRFGDTDWNYEGQFEGAREKARRLVLGGAKFAEFGTRRRRDYETQRMVMEGLMAGAKEATTSFSSLSKEAGAGQGSITPKSAGVLLGTSNLHFAHLYDLAPIGTLAHEWVMGTAAIMDDAGEANLVALQKWSQTYSNHLHIALTDTFTTEVFLANAWEKIVKDWDGVRHDSGDPFEFADRMSELFTRAGEHDTRTRTIVFSDGLSTDRALKLLEHMNCKEQPRQAATFGIGTHFTNDFMRLSKPDETSHAMNIVLKLKTCKDRICVKLSDDHGKESGTHEAVERVRRQIAKYAVA